ncbi:MAG: hypothetical protein Q8R08_04665 [bacterium]|nr:hypothetical protein [bacterium]
MKFIIILALATVVGAAQSSVNTRPKVTAVVNAAHPKAGLAPGSIISIYGENLAPLAATSAEPIHTARLNGTEVKICLQSANLIYVSPGQINAILFGAAYLWIGMECRVEVKTDVDSVTGDGRSSEIMWVPIVEEAWALFGSQLVPLITDVAGNPLGPDAPAIAGETVIGWGTGCKLFPASLAVTINKPVKVNFAGPTPGSPGVCQVNFEVPADLPTGSHDLWVGGFKYTIWVGARK